MADTESMNLLRDSARHFLSAGDTRERVREQERAGGGFDRTVWRQMAGLGWFSVLVPESAGGLGLGIAEACVIAQEVGRALPPEPVVDAGVHPAALLSRLPAGSLRDELLAGLQTGDLVMGVAWQESAGDLEAGEGMTHAGLVGADARLTGHKRFVRPGLGADGWIVSANLGDECGLFWLAAQASGLDVGLDAGVDGSCIARLSLDQAEGRLLAKGSTALDALKAANDLARIAQAAELAGIARRSLELTRDYLNTRVQFGRPIGSFQALQHRLVDGLIHVELAEASLLDGMKTIGEAPLAALASRLKARCAHAATEMTRMAIQMHGAIGTTNEYDAGLYFKRAMALASRWGNAGAHRRRWAQQIGRQVLEPSDNTLGERPDFSPHQAWEQMPERKFRAVVRALFAQHYPERRRYMPYRQTWSESRDWYMTLSRLGWLAPAWPRAHGGMGLPADKLIAYIEESEAWGIARAPDQGLVMVGPILMRFGTEAQRQRFLPNILAGEHVWTQGYSEPNAGSDLAAVSTSAVLDGDCFVVNGQKTWTTWGADGTHMFMLVRTDKTVKKQAGISFLLVDLKSPGVTVRPIRNLAGEDDFCEVFFDEVRVPRENLVGEMNQGWTVAKALLGFERLFTGSPKHSQHTLRQLEKLARQRGLFEDPAFVERLVQLQLDCVDLGSAYTAFADIAKRGEPIPATISMLKIWSTETYERLALLLIDSAQDYGTFRDHCHSDEIDLHVLAPLFNSMNAKIFAGSNEIQRNILAKAVLELPA